MHAAAAMIASPQGTIEQASTHPLVRRARTTEERHVAYRLRYEVYVEEMGKRPVDADHSARLLADAFDDEATVLLAEVNGEPVGTLQRTISRSRGSFKSLADALQVDTFLAEPGIVLSLSRRLAVKSSARGSLLLTAIAMNAYAEARNEGVTFEFLLSAPWLVPMYERLGYRRYTDGMLWTPDVGVLIPMVLVVRDHTWLAHVRSPFLRVATSWPAKNAEGEWLATQFPRVCEYYDSRPETGGESQQSHQRPNDPLRNTELARTLADRLGVSHADATELSRYGYVHRQCAGSLITAPDHIQRCLFLVLDGSATIQVDAEKPRGTVVMNAECLTRTTRSSSFTTVHGNSRLFVLPNEAALRLGQSQPEVFDRIKVAVDGATP